MTSQATQKNIFTSGKKGQLTIFIIVGIVLIASIALFFILRGGIRQEFTISESANVQSFILDCIDEVGNDIIEQIGEGGGYYFSSDKSTSSGLAIYYSGNENYIPSREEIEEEISFFVEENLFFCTRNFVDFPQLDISQRNIEVRTSIKDEEIILDVDYFVSVSKGDNTDVLRDFEGKIYVRLGIIYDSIVRIVQSSRQDICLSCILDISLDNDLYVDMNDVSDNEVMFVVRDENSKLNDESFDWVFVIDYE
jgi:hypothetical protein